MSSIFSKNIHPNIQKELYVRHKALENRRGKYVPDTGVRFSEMMSRTTYALLVTDYADKKLINKGIASGEFFEEGSDLRQTRFGFTADGLGSYRNTSGGSDTGIRPICGIKSVELEFLNANGVRKATVSWNAPSLEAVDEYSDFLRVGTRAALQFGWNYESNRFSDETFISFSDSNIKVDQNIYKNPFEKINASYGNMDALGGSVVNFSSKLRDDGGFDCTTEIMGFGISYMQDTDSQKADSTFKVSRQVREVLQSVKGPGFQSVVEDAANFLGSVGINKNDFAGAHGSATSEYFVRAIAYNDLDHAILNLDKICDKFINEFKDESRRLGYLGLEAPSKENLVTEEEVSSGPDTAQMTSFGGMGSAEMRETSRAAQIRYKTVTKQGHYITSDGNFFEVNNVISTETIGGEFQLDSTYKDETAEFIDTYVRWGWFEDNILTKYTAVVNDANQILNQFRSITQDKNSDGEDVIESNLIAYNENMIPQNFSDVFWASVKNDFIDQSAELKPQYLSLLEELNNDIIEVGREFNFGTNKGRLRNMFVNVSTIQEAYLGITNSQLDIQDDDGFLYAKPAVTNVRSGTTKIMNLLSKSLYNVPNLIIENNMFGAGITDQTLDGIVSNKSYSDSLMNPLIERDLGPNLSGQLVDNDDNFNGMYLFPSYEKGSIVKNQNFELNVPQKLASVGFLNSGGNLLTRKTHESEENKFAILAEHHGYPANSYLPAPFEKRDWGVKGGNEERIFSNQENSNFNYYGGLLSPNEWRKIPLQARVPSEKPQYGEVQGPTQPQANDLVIKIENGKEKIAIAREVINVTEEKTGFSGDIDDVTSGQTIRKVEKTIETTLAKTSDLYEIDENKSINWLESIRLKPKALEILRKLFLNENKGTSVDIERPIRWASLSLDVDGIGGLRPRNMFNCSYLPKVYNEQIKVGDVNYGPRYYFSIIGVTQKIDDSGWTTSIDSLMNLNYQAYRHLPASGLHNTSNAISSLSRNFAQSRQKTLTQRINAILEPISLAKTKFDTYMRESQDYVELQELAGTGSATPYSDSYEKWRKKREVRQRNKNAKEDLELAGKMASYINNLDIEPIGRDYILSSQAKAGPYTDVDYGLELVQQVQGNAKAPKDIRKVEFKPIQEEFPLTPVTVGSDTSNLMFETNAYRRVMSEDNVDIVYESNPTVVPPGFLPPNLIFPDQTDSEVEREFAAEGKVRAETVLTPQQLESFELWPEAYITQEQIKLINELYPSDAATKNKPVDEETAEVVDQSEGKNIIQQILGLFNKKTKEEVEKKNSPPQITSQDVRKGAQQRVIDLRNELGLSKQDVRKLYGELVPPELVQNENYFEDFDKNTGRYLVTFNFGLEVQGVTFKDGNGAVIEDYTTSSNSFTTTRREGQSPDGPAKGRAVGYYTSLAEENILQKYRDART